MTALEVRTRRCCFGGRRKTLRAERSPKDGRWHWELRDERGAFGKSTRRWPSYAELRRAVRRTLGVRLPRRPPEEPGGRR